MQTTNQKSVLDYASPIPEVYSYPPGFRPRRGINWVFLGLLYTSYYMCRYNIGFANPEIRKEYGFTKEEMGWVITISAITYGIGQIINGLLTDRIGGKKAMLIGATGTIIMNVLFGMLSFWTYKDPNTGQWVVPFLQTGAVFSLLGMFALFRGIDRYLQAFGAPGMVKINAAWFRKTERGSFAGIFGFMINLGRILNNLISPLILSGFLLFGIWAIESHHWRWLFFVPSVVCGLMAICMALTVKESPEAAGFLNAIPHDGPQNDGNSNTHERLSVVLRTILSKPAIWFVASAYFCTGVVRGGIDEWYPSYMKEVHNMNFNTKAGVLLGIAVPLMASLGSFISGVISDKFCKGGRAPVAAVLYLIETFIILAATQFVSANAAVTFFILIALTANSTHSLLGTAAAMDIGGRKMAGFSAGLIDSFQYFGSALTGAWLGSLLDHSWSYYYYFLAPFGFAGCIIMIIGSPWMKKASGASAH